MINETRIKNNKVTLSGEIVSNFEFSHEVYGEGFYTTMLASERTSGQKDIIPIMVSERLINIAEEKGWVGQKMNIFGQFRSFNKHEESRNKLMLYVFAHDFIPVDEIENENHVSLGGYICKPPVYRKIPLGREIADILLAVNRPYGKSDYIPTICWGRNARFTSGLEVGTRLQIEGRIQSREYQKRISDDEYEARIAYEVSISKMETKEEVEESE